MIKYKNLTLVGTSHIAGESVEQVKKAIRTIKPEIVAVELDNVRMAALFEKNQKSRVRLSDIRNLGVTGFLFMILGRYVQKKLGNKTFVEPGTEMLEAIKAARSEKAKIALIDQRLEITLKKLSQKITVKEKFRFFVDILKGIFSGRKQMQEMGLSSFDLNKTPDAKVVEKLIGYLEKRYPSVYEVLVRERNEIMGKKLIYLMKHNEGEIVGVIGLGHSEGMLRFIKENINSVDVM